MLLRLISSQRPLRCVLLTTTYRSDMPLILLSLFDLDILGYQELPQYDASSISLGRCVLSSVDALTTCILPLGGIIGHDVEAGGKTRVRPEPRRVLRSRSPKQFSSGKEALTIDNTFPIFYVLEHNPTLTPPTTPTTAIMSYLRASITRATFAPSFTPASRSIGALQLRSFQSCRILAAGKESALRKHWNSLHRLSY